MAGILAAALLARAGLNAGARHILYGLAPGRLTCGDLEVVPAVYVRGLILRDAHGQPLVSCGSLRVGYNLLALWGAPDPAAAVRSVRVEHPVIVAELTGRKGPDLTPIIRRLRRALEAFHGLVTVDGGEVRVVDAREPRIARPFTALHAVLDRRAAGASVAAVEARERGRVRWRARAAWTNRLEDARVAVDVDGFDLPFWIGWGLSRHLVPLPRGMIPSVRAGTVSAHLQLRSRGREPHAVDDLDAVGSVSLRGLRASLAAGGRTLALRRADGDFRVDGDRLEIERFTAATELGRARLSGRVSDLHDPQVELRASLTCPSLQAAARALHLALPVEGRARLSLELHGSALDPRVSGRLEAPWLAVRRGGRIALRNLAAALAWHDGILEVWRCAARCGRGTVALNGWILPDASRRNASLMLMARARDADLPAALGFPGARATVDAAILGTLTDPLISAQVACNGLHVGPGHGLPTVSAVRGRFLALRSGVLFDGVRADTSAGAVEAPAGVVDVDPRRLGPRAVRHLSAAVSGRGLSLALPGYGSISRAGFSAFVSGTLTHWVAAGAASAHRVAAPQGVLQDLAAAFVASPAALDLAGARFRWSGMPFHASASATPAGAFQADLVSSAFDAARAAASRGIALPRLPDLTGRLLASACGTVASAVVDGGLATACGSFSLQADVERWSSVFALFQGRRVDVGRLARSLRLGEKPTGTLALDGAVRARGTSRAAFALEATSRSLRVRGLPITRLAAEGDYAGATLHLRRIRGESPLAWAEAWGQARPATRSYRIHWTAALRRLEAVFAALGAGVALPPHTALSLRHGTLVASGTLSGSGTEMTARVASGRADLGPSEIAFAGSAHLGRTTAVDLRARLRDLDLGSLQPLAAGTVSGSMRVRGTFPKVKAEGVLSVAQPYLSVPGLSAAAAAQMHFDDAVLRLSPTLGEDGRVPVGSLALPLGNSLGGRTFLAFAAHHGSTTVSGQGSGGADGFAFDWNVRGFPLRGLLASAARGGVAALAKPLQPVLEAARADLSLHVAGPARRIPDASLRFAIRLPQQRWTVLHGNARFTGSDRTLRLDDAVLSPPETKGTATLRGSLRVPERMPAKPQDLLAALSDVVLAFHAFPLRRALDAALRQPPATPEAAARVAASLLVPRPEATGPSASPLQPVLDGEVKLAGGTKGVGVLTLSGLGPGSATARGSWEGRQGRVHLVVPGLDLGVLHEVLPRVAMSGTVSADVHMEKGAGPPAVDGTVQLTHPTVQGVALGDVALDLSRKDPVYTLAMRSQALGSGTVSWNRESGELQGKGTDGARGQWTIDAGPAGPSYLASLSDAQVYLYGSHLRGSVTVPGSGPASISVQVLNASALVRPRLKYYKLSLTDPTIEMSGAGSDDPTAALERFARLDFLHLPDRTEIDFHMDRGVVHGTPLPPTSADYQVGAPNLLYGYTWLDTPVGRISLDRRDEDPHVTRLIRHLIHQLANTPASQPVERIQLQLHLDTLRREVEPPRVGLRARQEEVQSTQSPELGNVLLYAPARNLYDSARQVQTGKESAVNLVNNVARSVVPPDVARAQITNTRGIVSRFFLQLFHDPAPVPIQQPVEAYGAGYRLGPQNADGKPIGELRQSLQAWYDSLGLYHLFYQVGLPFRTGRKQ